MYAVEHAPRIVPKTASNALSKNPNPKTIGPNRPVARLFSDRFALNHSTATCKSAALEGSCRSSGRTRSMPRASSPARFSMRLFSFWKDESDRLGGLELSSPVGVELTVADFSCVASAVCVGRDIMRSVEIKQERKKKGMNGTQKSVWYRGCVAGVEKGCK
jgi:hypothetical protein